MASYPWDLSCFAPNLPRDPAVNPIAKPTVSHATIPRDEAHLDWWQTSLGSTPGSQSRGNPALNSREQIPTWPFSRGRSSDNCHREKQIQDQIEDHCRIDEVELDRASQALTRAKNLLSKSGKYGAPMVTSLQTPLINQSPLSLLPCQRILRILHLADNPNPARSFRSSSRRTANLRPAQVRNLKVA